MGQDFGWFHCCRSTKQQQPPYFFCCNFVSWLRQKVKDPISRIFYSCWNDEMTGAGPRDTHLKMGPYDEGKRVVRPLPLFHHPNHLLLVSSREETRSSSSRVFWDTEGCCCRQKIPIRLVLIADEYCTASLFIPPLPPLSHPPRC